MSYVDACERKRLERCDAVGAQSHLGRPLLLIGVDAEVGRRAVVDPLVRDAPLEEAARVYTVAVRETDRER